MAKKAFKVELWPIEKIKPYKNNPRINDSAVDAVAASLAGPEFAGLIKKLSETWHDRQPPFTQENLLWFTGSRRFDTLALS